MESNLRIKADDLGQADGLGKIDYDLGRIAGRGPSKPKKHATTNSVTDQVTVLSAPLVPSALQPKDTTVSVNI